MNWRRHFLEEAARSPGRIVLAEGDDERVREAAERLGRDRIAQVLLLAPAGATIPPGVESIIVEESPLLATFARAQRERVRRGQISEREALAEVRDPVVFAAHLVAGGHADGAVMGAVATTAEVLRAAIRVVGVRPGHARVSSSFVMLEPEDRPSHRMLVFSDCAVVPEPDPEALASIAAQAVDTWSALSTSPPKVAFLSFSTLGSAKHARVDRVREAHARFRKMSPGVESGGELQLDAALVPAIAARKAAGESVAGQANILIFPDLDSGNIAYKLAERLGGWIALGPLLQGLVHPIQDLSRGCSAMDIVETVALTVLLARTGRGAGAG